MKINEIFYSLQGEGMRTGEPSVFVRLANCNLACGFCDTEFESGQELTDAQLLAKIIERTADCRWIVWTGGEPLLQLTALTIAFFRLQGYRQALETNGSFPLPAPLDWVVCSPKVAEHVVAKNFPDGVDELRYVRHSGQFSVPEPRIKASVRYLSPLFDGNQVNQENLKHCTNLCLQHPQWRLSVQTHKLMKIL